MLPNEDGGHNDDDCFNYLFLIQEWLAEKHNECYKSNQKRIDDKNYHSDGFCFIRVVDIYRSHNLLFKVDTSLDELFL